jgi:hypothetical protein
VRLGVLPCYLAPNRQHTLQLVETSEIGKDGHDTLAIYEFVATAHLSRLGHVTTTQYQRTPAGGARTDARVELPVARWPSLPFERIAVVDLASDLGPDPAGVDASF